MQIARRTKGLISTAVLLLAVACNSGEPTQSGEEATVAEFCRQLENVDVDLRPAADSALLDEGELDAAVGIWGELDGPQEVRDDLALAITGFDQVGDATEGLDEPTFDDVPEGALDALFEGVDALRRLETVVVDECGLEVVDRKGAFAGG